MDRKLFLIFSLVSLAATAWAQQRVEPVNAQERVSPADPRANPDAPRQIGTPTTSGASAEALYVLGPFDLISVQVPDLDENFTADRSFRLDQHGDVNLPFVGIVHAGGLTTDAFAKQVEAGLKGRILKNPQVIVTVTEFHSQPVSVLGEVNSPGLHQIAGEKNLFAALSAAGGFSENLGNTITITRNLKWGRIPLPDSHDDPTGQFSVGSMRVKTVLKALDPSENIPLMPDDVITVSRSEVVYAVGSVNKPGGFELGQNENLTSLQVISLAEGLSKTAAPSRAIILRVDPTSKARTQIPVNVKTLLAGNSPDIPLQANDILFIPNSRMKSTAYHTLDIMQYATAALVYRF